ncbi:TPA: hypothetical protein N0F65_000127 [Lagenidium giganteum]|uniref:RNase III domain-containing protein n=1 Tax=Lagenidium giganteum TaxID=4803 RepID=A0AAV2YYF0_9STRA|nr:TPA: hypothetical protein N0F65_000127 [Lagenidium giganteum]
MAARSQRGRKQQQQMTHKLNTTAEPHDLETTPLPTRFLVHPEENDAWKVIKDEHFQHVPIPAGWEAQLEALQQRLGVTFRDVTHLKCALIHHGSFVHNQMPLDIKTHRLSNRSLEHLGDSILGMCVASHLFQSHPDYQEGQLTKAKAELVNNYTLSKICVQDLVLHKLILVAPDYDLSVSSSKATFVKGRRTIHAGTVESLIAAVYLDQGLEAALEFVNARILPPAMKHATNGDVWEPVTALQNLLQAHGYGHPTYRYADACTRLNCGWSSSFIDCVFDRHLPGPAESESKKVTLLVQGEDILTGTGSSYKVARINAAEEGYRRYQQLLGASNSGSD